MPPKPPKKKQKKGTNDAPPVLSTRTRSGQTSSPNSPVKAPAQSRAVDVPLESVPAAAPPAAVAPAKPTRGKPKTTGLEDEDAPKGAESIEHGNPDDANPNAHVDDKLLAKGLAEAGIANPPPFAAQVAASLASSSKATASASTNRPVNSSRGRKTAGRKKGDMSNLQLSRAARKEDEATRLLNARLLFCCSATKSYFTIASDHPSAAAMHAALQDPDNESLKYCTVTLHSPSSPDYGGKLEALGFRAFLHDPEYFRKAKAEGTDGVNEIRPIILDEVIDGKTNYHLPSVEPLLGFSVKEELDKIIMKNYGQGSKRVVPNTTVHFCDINRLVMHDFGHTFMTMKFLHANFDFIYLGNYKGVECEQAFHKK